MASLVPSSRQQQLQLLQPGGVLNEFAAYKLETASRKHPRQEEVAAAAEPATKKVKVVASPAYKDQLATAEFVRGSIATLFCAILPPLYDGPTRVRATLARLSHAQHVKFTHGYNDYIARLNALLPGAPVRAPYPVSLITTFTILIKEDTNRRKKEAGKTRFAMDLSGVTKKLADKLSTPIANLIGRFASADVTIARPVHPNAYRRSA